MGIVVGGLVGAAVVIAIGIRVVGVAVMGGLVGASVGATTGDGVVRMGLGVGDCDGGTGSVVGVLVVTTTGAGVTSISESSIINNAGTIIPPLNSIGTIRNCGIVGGVSSSPIVGMGSVMIQHRMMKRKVECRIQHVPPPNTILCLPSLVVL